MSRPLFGPAAQTLGHVQTTRLLDRLAEPLDRSAPADFRDRERDCPVCPRIAWYASTGPDGMRAYMCAAGHLLIVDEGNRS